MGEKQKVKGVGVGVPERGSSPGRWYIALVTVATWNSRDVMAKVVLE